MNFYHAFAEKHRGSRDLIKSRLLAYLPFIDAVKKIYPQALAVDLGCGRGEWLELLSEQGFSAQGVDIDKDMLGVSQKLNLNAQFMDALDFLKTLPSESQSIVSGFHLAEHLPFDDLRKLVEEAKRVLLPAGLLILETPNPENIVVGTSNFYLDPTHQRPLPPNLLAFLPEYYGYSRTKIIRLQEIKAPGNDILHLNHVLHNVSQDYAIIAQKAAVKELSSLFDDAFNQEYGVDLEQLASQYDEQLLNTQSQLNHATEELTLFVKSALAEQAREMSKQTLEIKKQKNHSCSLENMIVDMQTVNHQMQMDLNAQFLKINTQLEDLNNYTSDLKSHLSDKEHQLQRSSNELQAVYNSKSWRLTRPLRELNFFCSRMFLKIKTLARSLFLNMAVWIAKHSLIKKLTLDILKWNPKLLNKLSSVYQNYLNQTPRETHQVIPSSIANDHNSYFVGTRILYLYVDHTVNFPSNTGIQRVVRNLAHGLIAQGEQVCFVKWDYTNQMLIAINLIEREHLAAYEGPKVTPSERAFYSSAQTLPWYRSSWLIVPEVTHTTFHPKPVTLDLINWCKANQTKIGFIYHDALPLQFPEYKTTAKKHAQYMKDLLKADVVWPNSQYSTQELLLYWQSLNISTPSMPAVETQSLSGAVARTPRIQTTGTHEKMILSVGTLEPRKNQIKLIRAFIAYREKNPNSVWRLVLAGNLHPLISDEVMRTCHADNHIEYFNHVSDELLHDLYSRCAFTVFPSIAEGFGLPIIESLWYAKPCICANFGAMVEVAKEGGCICIDTHHEHEIEVAITDLIEHPEKLLQLTHAAMTRPIKTLETYATGMIQSINAHSSLGSNIGLIYFWMDATIAFNKNTGIQRVCRQLAKSMLNAGLNLIPVKLHNGQFVAATTQDLDAFSQWHGPEATLWHPFVAPDLKVKNSWFLMPELPLNIPNDEHLRVIEFAEKSGLKRMAIFYDAIPLKVKQIFSLVCNKAHYNYMLTLAKYNLILPISHYSECDLHHFIANELPDTDSFTSSIITVPLAGDFPGISRVTNATINRHPICKIVTLGTVESRKNHKILLEAYRIAQQSTDIEIELIIAGRIIPDFGDFIHAFIKDHPNVSWESDADDARVQTLLQSCDFTVFPSIEEGFGLPILESLWYAKPCICANFGAMQEVAIGGGCLMVDVRDAQTLATAIIKLAEDTVLRQKLVQEAVSRPFKTWDDYAQEVTMHLVDATTKRQEKNHE